MIRKILGFAVVAFVALLVFKIALGLLGVLIGASAIWLGLEAAWAVSLAVALFAATAAIALHYLRRLDTGPPS